MLSRFPRCLLLALSVAVVSSLVPVAASADPNPGAGHLHGLVEDEDGHAVADARIRLWDMASGAAVAEAVTDGDGRYTALLPAGHYDMTADAIKDGTPVEAKVRDVEVGAGRGLNLVLAGMPVEIARLTGTVRDGTGAPVPFTWITVDDGNTVTDAEGKFLLETPDGGRGLRVSPPMADDASVVAEAEDFTLDGDQTLDLTLPLVTVDVTVRDRAGSPVAGAEVRLQSQETCASCAGAFELYEGAATSRQATITRRTGADGKVHLVTLPASSLSLTVTHQDGRYQTVQLVGLSAPTSTAFNVELPPAATTMSAASVPSGSAFSASAAGSVSLTGRVTDFGGLNDPDHIYMTLMDGDTAVAGHGGDAASPFELSAPAGTYTLTLQAASEEDGDDWEYRPEDDWAQVSVEDFSLHQDRTVELRLPLVGFPVRVLDADGAPVADAWVESGDGTAPTTGEPFPGAEASGSFRSHRWTDATGVATLRVLPGVPFTVSVDPPGGRGLPKDVRIPGTATGAEIQVDDAPTLQGHVRSTEGWPIRPEHGWLVPDSGPQRPFTFGPDGAYAVSALPGRYRIQLDTFEEFYRPSEDEDAWRATTTGSIEITGDTTLDLTVPWHGGAAAWAVDADGWADSGEFDNGFTGSSVADFELAPGLFASSTFSVWGPGTFETLSAGSVLAPSRTKTYFNPDEGRTILLPRLYLAPKEDTVVAQLGRWRGPAAPQDVRAFGDIDGTATVSWAPPATDRGSPVLGYVVTAEGNREIRRLFVPAPSTSAPFSGLATSESYAFWVMAVSARGTSNSNGMRILIPGPASPPTTQPGNPPPPPTTPNQTGGTGTPPASAPATSDPAASGASVAGRSGYWMLESEGHVYAFGDAAHLGDASQRLRGADAVDLEPTPSGAGYWILDHHGVVSAHGDATHHGDVNRAVLATGETATSLSATPTAQGYWVFTSRGRVLPFGDATFLGDMSTVALNGPVLDSIPTPSGHGYYMVASDGGIFTFGDARFAGSMGGTHLNAPVQSLVPDGDGAGYWLVTADGGIFSFDAPFRGSMGAIRLNKPVTGMVRHGNGYLMVGEDGGIFNFSNQPFSGSLGDRPPARPIVSVAAVS